MASHDCRHDNIIGSLYGLRDEHRELGVNIYSSKIFKIAESSLVECQYFPNSLELICTKGSCDGGLEPIVCRNVPPTIFSICHRYIADIIIFLSVVYEEAQNKHQ